MTRPGPTRRPRRPTTGNTAIDRRLPIILTWSRIALIPLMVIAYYLPFAWAPGLTAFLFALAAITDWFDGYLARRWGVTTAFGAFLDPVADKLLVAVALILIVEANPTPWTTIPAAVIIGREITISALREWMAVVGEGKGVKVAFIGKVKTTAQMGALTLLLYNQPLAGLPLHEVGIALLLLALILTLWSMVLYLRAAWPHMRG